MSAPQLASANNSLKPVAAPLQISGLWRFRAVSIVLGLVFVAAGLLKASSLWQDSLTPLELILPAKWQIVWIGCEVALGFWLIWGGYPHFLWVSALLTLCVTRLRAFG